jgi:hypothetical protein
MTTTSTPPDRFEMGAFVAIVFKATIGGAVAVLIWIVAKFALGATELPVPGVAWLAPAIPLPGWMAYRETVRQIAAGDLPPETSPALVAAAACVAVPGWMIALSLGDTGSTRRIGLKVVESPVSLIAVALTAVAVLAAMKLGRRRRP